MRKYASQIILGSALLSTPVFAQDAAFDPASGIPAGGLHAAFPSNYHCPPITSYFGSMLDVDGSEREEVHTGVDLGNWGDAIIAPADGHVVSVRQTDEGNGPEWTVLFIHTAAEMGLSGSFVIYSEFYHLDDAVSHLQRGQAVRRGDKVAIVRVPGGNQNYLPETHWDTYRVPESRVADTYWYDVGGGVLSWSNDAEVLVNPLALMPTIKAPDKRSEIVPFDASHNYDGFAGFTYPLVCTRD